MLSNIYLFTGEEQFLLDKELGRRKENFVQKFGSDSIFSFSLESLDVGMLKQSIYGGGLFVTKKMVIFNGLPYEGLNRPVKDLQEQLDKFMDDLMAKEGKIPEETLLVFISTKPDKRLKFYKFLERNATLKEFNQLKPKELKDFIISQLSGIFIPNDVVEHLLFKVGGDLYRLWFECEKLKIWCEVKKKSTVSTEIIDKVTFGMVETDAFAFLDLALTDMKKAVAMLDKIQDNADNRNAFAGSLYRGLRFSLFLVDFAAQGVKDAKEIAAMMGGNPWQITNAFKKVKQLQEHRSFFRYCFRELVELDYKIKSGKLPDTYFWLGIKNMIKSA